MKTANPRAMIIYNPQAGLGIKLPGPVRKMVGIRSARPPVKDAAQLIELIKNLLRERGIRADASPTKYAGHATAIAAKCVRKKFDIVVAVGGDGTINEVINGLAKSKVALGIIPLGTANVFAIELGLPTEIEALCDIIAAGKIRRIDLGKVNKRYFACMAGIGLDAYILEHADRKLKRVYGALAYPIVAILHGFSYRFRKIKVKVDDQPVRTGHLVFICNGKYYGGKMVMAEKADNTDGYLDVCICKYKGFLNFIGYMLAIWYGNFSRLGSVEYLHCRNLKVKKKGRHPVHVDAEYYGKTPVKIKIVPKALNVIVPGLDKENSDA